MQRTTANHRLRDKVKSCNKLYLMCNDRDVLQSKGCYACPTRGGCCTFVLSRPISKYFFRYRYSRKFLNNLRFTLSSLFVMPFLRLWQWSSCKVRNKTLHCQNCSKIKSKSWVNSIPLVNIYTWLLIVLAGYGHFNKRCRG